MREGMKRKVGIFPPDWKVMPLEKISVSLSEKAGVQELETLSISAGIGFVNQAKKFGKELSGKQYINYTVLRRGDFSYNKGNSKTYPQGCIYRLDERDIAAVPNVFNSFRLKDGICNSDYYAHLFINGYMNHQLYRLINAGVRNDGLLNLYSDDFYGCLMPVPPLHEQGKIAEILNHCDKVIALKQQLIEEERKRKKWLMQNLLDPDSGVRLPGFCGEWQQTRLGNHVVIHSGDAPVRFSFADSGMPYYKVDSLNFGEKYIVSTEYHIEPTFRLVPAMSIIFPKRGAAIMNNKIRINKFNCQIDSNLMALTPKKTIITDFLYYLLSNESLFKIADTSTIPQINNKHIVPYVVIIPSVKEQTAIVKILSISDIQIELLEQELQQWQQKKKALMQLLLTGIVRVSV